MKQSYDNFDAFITEQRAYYEKNLNQTNTPWSSNVWGKMDELGWLVSSQDFKGFNVSDIKRLTGYENISISSAFKDFIKAMCVAKYRRRKCGAVALQAFCLGMKRCYSVMVETTAQIHPSHLTTSILETVDKRNEELGLSNLSDKALDLITIQDQINLHSFAISPLLFKNKRKSSNKANLSRKADKLKKEKDDLFKNDITRDTEKLITLDAFIHIAQLSNNVKPKMEKIGMKVLDILIVSGFRGTECITLLCDCLIERNLYDEKTGDILLKNGKPKIIYGLKYFAMKNAQTRIHWIEPKAYKVIKRALDEVKLITKPYREYIKNLRKTGVENLLPDTYGAELTIDELAENIVTVSECGRGMSGYRDRVVKALRNRGVLPLREKAKGRRRIFIYSRQDVEKAIRESLDREDILTVALRVNKQICHVNLEDLLFIAPKGALNIVQQFRFEHAITPLNQRDLMNFLGGGADKRVSIFKKYGVKEASGKVVSIPTHFPRHNINTFLDLCGVNDHVQAMAMGRTDIKQNLSYQHTSLLETNRLEEKRAATSVQVDDSISQRTLVNHEFYNDNSDEMSGQLDGFDALCDDDIFAEFGGKELILSPAENVLSNGVMMYSPAQSLEHNLHREWHSADNEELLVGFMTKAMDEDEFLGEMQDTYNHIKKNEGPVKAKEFITHNPHLHPVVNGDCTRDVAKSGCPHRLKCLSGKGCSYLMMTGRSGEYENLAILRNNLQLALLEATKKFGSDPGYTEHIQSLKNDLSQTTIALAEAKMAKEKRITIQVFPEGEKIQTGSSRPKTLIDLFAEQQLIVEEEYANKKRES